MPHIRPKLIGLHGKKYVGKDTAALGLIEHGYTRLAFADPLRDLLYDINPILHVGGDGYVYRWQEVWDTEGYEVLKTMPEARRLMQEVGTRIRERDPDFWVRLAAKTIDSNPDVRGWVITDVRFDNEALLVRQRCGEVVEIVRDTMDYDSHGAAHISEAGITRSLIDYTLYNESTVEELHELVRNVAGV
jgi:hypothetical protein